MTDDNNNNKKELHVFHDSKIEEELEHQHEEQISQGCGVCGGCGGFCGWVDRNRILTILIFASIGAAIGVGLSYWEPEDPNSKEVCIQWLGLVGDLFLRSLKCFVLPLVFVNVIISVVEMMAVGKASSIGWYVTGLYLLTTILAGFFGTMSTLMFKGLYSTLTDEEVDEPATIQLGCVNDGFYLAEMDNGSVMCSADYAPDDANVNFVIEDISKTFVTTSGNVASVSLSDTIYNGIFTKIVPSNIIGAFAGNNFAAVIFFAILFGAALSKVVAKVRGKESYVIGFLKECDAIFQITLNWIIFITPFAVCSLIAKAIGKQDDLPAMFKNIGALIGAALVGWGMQFLFTYVGLFAIMTKSNPFGYLKYIIPAQTMAFASASSAATIPSSLAAVKSTGRVPDTIGRFVVPLGATVNMDGGAVYFVTASIWLAVLNGEEVTAASYILLIIIATVGSIGTAPVPSASLVLIITAYNTVFNTTGTPDGFEYIFAIDWFMDRCRTVTNVTGDCVVTGIVSARCDIGDEQIPDMSAEVGASTSRDDSAEKVDEEGSA
mmetsp:Transcript_4708/g.11995  ORF Transcript_4708/g.11995 Transcript_4708/m.11995 type:complete len:549 (+) Transcript_4708:450-2096(+)|eukprot:CAMPEP_0113458868 /NCGR_PEP_ID=MMETSP0014_2-20120614/10146_1 /TAXON_ID=2857 /ORGANISM="Nitzschia sp." /LENGTH=548 /DNA_ID=CAMNT_0000350409 /DNA_START=824 /DNA_END=2470 /DNA_ORIENTATION=+ /assembly_acc=CAM_ASM_000159